MADAPPTPPPDPSKKSPFAIRAGKATPVPSGPSPFASKVDRKLEPTAPIIPPKPPPTKIRTVPWTAVVLIGGVILSAALYFAYPLLDRVFRGTTRDSAPTEIELRRAEIARRNQSGAAPTPGASLEPPPTSTTLPVTSTPVATPSNTVEASVLPPDLLSSRVEVLELIDFLRYACLTPADLQRAHDAALAFADAQRTLDRGDRNGALARWRQQQTSLGDYAIGLAKRKLERVAQRLNDPLIAEHSPGVADEYVALLTEGAAAESSGDRIGAVRAYERAEQAVLRAWLGLPDIIQAKFEVARAANDREAGLRYQQQLQRLRQPAPALAAAGSGQPTVVNRPPQRFVVARDPVPPGVVIWEAERLATSPRGVQSDKDASGGRYAAQHNPARAIVEFGFPPGLSSMTLWVRFRGSEVVFESANPGSQRTEAGRTSGGAGTWEWKRIGTFERDGLGSTLSLSNFDNNAWSGIDMILVSADPSIVPQ